MSFAVETCGAIPIDRPSTRSGVISSVFSDIALVFALAL